MAKPYWRVKRNGKWTWAAARVYSDNAKTTIVYNYEAEEVDSSEDYCRALEEEE